MRELLERGCYFSAGRQRPVSSLKLSTTPSFAHVKGQLSKAGGLAPNPTPLDFYCISCYNIKKRPFLGVGQQKKDTPEGVS